MKIVTVFSLLVFIVAFLYCGVETTKPETSEAATYVGTDKCQGCHSKEYANYVSSDHFHAMDSALPRSVKGDFNNSFFVYYGDTTRFYQRDDGYYVSTKDSLGKKSEFPVSFTFGWQPLQQYLVRFGDGRIQALPFCWDTRPKEKGGQRWFHIYNKEKILPGDELFWTGINQNWNNMCADCHTTDYFKQFDAASNTFHSKWKENKVSCESCHGAASRHLQWAEKKEAVDSLKGFAINLSGKKIKWTFDAAKGIAYPDQAVNNTTLVETCARCHARASRLSDNYHHGQSFLQTHIPATINTVNYYIDGQIKEEDYEYGSFLQSKMYSMGVTCVNCHEPHSMQLKAEGNVVCATCHAPDKFDVEAHTHHQVNGAGSQCVNCHMPVTTYMVVDERRDHSIRIPRPDLSLATGAPNACNKCHTNESTAWASKSFLQWYGDKLPKNKTYSELLYAISKNEKGSEDAFHQLLSSKTYPPIIKATALEQYNQFYSPRIIEEIKNNLKSNDPNLRLQALQAAPGLPAEVILPLLTPMINDPVLSVRTEAMNALAPQYAQLDGTNRQTFDVVLNEYLAIQRNMSDRPEGYLNQGNVLLAIGRTSEAGQIYLQGLKRFPTSVRLYANTADLYRATGNEEKAKDYVQRALLIEPGNATIHYAMAMWNIRNHDIKAGMNEIRQAIRLDPSDPSFAYAYAVALHTNGQSQQAIHSLENFIAKNGNAPQVISVLISLYQDSNQPGKADNFLSLRKSVFGY
jgi:tetratricopeptide (TPR) repeat protein